MYSWDCVRKALGHDHSRILYLEEQLASLVDQSEDLKNEINSLKMIANDVRPVMSPDKTFELVLNEISLLFRRIATEDMEEIKVKENFFFVVEWVLLQYSLFYIGCRLKLNVSFFILGRMSASRNIQLDF